jgi:hypothetical protein
MSGSVALEGEPGDFWEIQIERPLTPANAGMSKLQWRSAVQVRAQDVAGISVFTASILETDSVSLRLRWGIFARSEER